MIVCVTVYVSRSCTFECVCIRMYVCVFVSVSVCVSVSHCLTCRLMSLSVLLWHFHGNAGLEIIPGDTEVILSADSAHTITCSGSTPVTWRYRRDENVPNFEVENSSPGSAVLRLENVTWRHTGVYVCTEEGSRQTREVAVFVPGETYILTHTHTHTHTHTNTDKRRYRVHTQTHTLMHSYLYSFTNTDTFSHT